MNWIEEQRARLTAKTQTELVDELINRELNEFVARFADWLDDEALEGRTSRVPYIGWYWRDVDFANGVIRLGDCGEFKGFMENNKWDYPERRLSIEETEKVLEVVLRAHAGIVGESVVSLADLDAHRKAVLGELWDLLQTFPIEIDGWWIFGPQGRVAFSETTEGADVLIAALQEAAPGLVYRKEHSA